MKFYGAEKLVEKANKVLSELPGDFKRQDKEEGTKHAKQFELMLQMMKEQNDNMVKMIAAINQ